MSDPSSFVLAIPRLATDRLLLREHRSDDFERFALSVADPIGRAHIGGALDRREAWRRFTSMTGNWVIQGIGWWAVELPGTGAIGCVGVFRREISPELEIGWGIDREHWGKGYAPEAAGAALRFAVERVEPRVVAFIAPANTQSASVARKIGMRMERELEFYGSPHQRYAFGPDA